MTDTKIPFVDRLRKEPVLVAEGYLFELERRGYLKAGPFVPQAVLDHPEAVRQLHEEFLRAGSDVMVAFTYYGHRAKMQAVDLEDRLEELNRTALQIARQAADRGRVYMAGNLSNTWVYEPNSDQAVSETRRIFDEQVGWALDGRADFIIAETFGFLGEARLALESIRASGLPAVITFSPATGRCCDGYSWEEACKILSDEGAAVVGLNCGNGPDTLLPYMEKIRARVDGFVAALPVPYRTTQKQPCFQKLQTLDGRTAFPVGLDPFQLTRYEMADFAVRARDMGVDYIGICCGAGPHHVRAMAEALGRNPAATEYSPDMSLHPVFGDKNKRRPYVECLFGPMDETE